MTEPCRKNPSQFATRSRAISMTTEARRASMRAHLLSWTFAINAFGAAPHRVSGGGLERLLRDGYRTVEWKDPGAEFWEQHLRLGWDHHHLHDRALRRV